MASTQVEVWLARLDGDESPEPDLLSPAERERAAQLGAGAPRRRWVAARRALRRVLGESLGCDPAAVELRIAARGKPELAETGADLRFNLSHSGELALIAVARGSEVGVDVQRLGRRSAGFYQRWARREAIAKCHGVGLWTALPERPVTAIALDAPPGYAAALAIAGETAPAVAPRALPARR